MDNEFLGSAHRLAWENVLLAHSSLIRKMDARMALVGKIPLGLYDILLALEEAPDRRLTMSELGRKAVLSPSGVTRLVDRMERAGLVSREMNLDDRRSTFAVLTLVGLQTRIDAWPAFRAAIREEFASKLSDDEADALSELLSRFVEPGIGTRIHTKG